MAESFVAVSNDITSLQWNPAGLVSFKENGITASYTRWFVDTKLSNFGGVYHFGGSNALGISIISSKHRRHESNDRISAEQEQVNISDFRIYQSEYHLQDK